MQKLFWLIPVVVLLAVFSFGIFPKSSIVNTNDYHSYLNPEHLSEQRAQLDSEIKFWQEKLKEAPQNFVYQQKLAGCYASVFKKTGEVDFLHQSDSLLHQINDRLPDKVDILQMLAMNAITQHQFSEAQGYLKTALAVGEEKFASTLLMTDVLLERGLIINAEKNLTQIQNPKHFDYLIRQMKLQDAKDQLPKAIDYMEQACAQASASNNIDLMNWSYANLGDMYGHDGKIRQAYQSYLKALLLDHADLHALEGIAWISFAHDDNPAEAKRILNFLKEIHPIPDYELALAEIAAYEGEEEQALAYEASFRKLASKAAYGKMYYTYLIELDPKETLAEQRIAEEALDRPHPVIFDLQAWTYFHLGNKEEAIQILEDHVLGQSGEPIIAYHAGMIYESVGNKKLAKKYLRAAKAASFELGPNINQEVERALQNL